MLAPLAMTMPMPSAGLPRWRTRKLGGSSKPRVTVAMSPRRKHAAAGFDRRVGDRLDAVEGAGDAQRHALRAGLDGAGRDDGVLLRQRIEERLRRNAERRELGVAELDEDLLVLDAIEIDLGDARPP